ncbi:MAG: hypothetical protein AAF570_13695, partial [Bacteroidota bacterium]
MDFAEHASNKMEVPTERILELKHLIASTRDFEIGFLINSIKTGLIAAVNKKQGTEINHSKGRLARLEGGNSDFFLELLLSVIVEIIPYGKIVGKGAGAIGKVLKSTFLRAKTFQSFVKTLDKVPISSFLNTQSDKSLK